MSPRRLLVVPACLLSFAAVAAVAAATQLGGVSALGLGADAAAVEPCDRDGVRAALVRDAMTVTGVVIDGLAADCAGATVHLTVSGVGGQVRKSAAVVGAGPTHVALPAPLGADAVTGIAVVVKA